MVWTGVHRGFVVRAYYENNRSMIATQRVFRRNYFQHKLEEMTDKNDLGDIWFQQDGVATHTLKTRLLFCDKWTRRG